MVVLSAPHHQAATTRFARRAFVPRIGRSQGISRINYKEQNRPEDSIKNNLRDARDSVRDAGRDAREGAKDAYRDARDSARDTGRNVRDSARDAGNQARNAAENVRDDVSDAAHRAGRNVNDAADRLGQNVNNAASEVGDRLRNTGERFANTVDRTGQRLDEEAGKANGATVGYLTSAVVIGVATVFGLFKPDSALMSTFRHAVTVRGADIAELTGSLASSTYLLQVLAILAVPVITGLICQAHNSAAGHLDSDSAMRLNYGIFTYFTCQLTTFITSPLRPYIGGGAMVAFAAYFCLMAVTVYTGVRHSRRFDSVSQLSNEMTQGFISTLGRTLSPKSLIGSIYGIFAAISAFAAAHLTFGLDKVTSYFNTIAGELTFQGAHADVVNFLTGGVVTNLIFATIAFVALKELADKGALATRTARFLNVGLSSTLIGLGFILNHGTQKGIVSSQGSAIWGLASQVSAVMLLASIILTLYPRSNQSIKEDTADECYA